MENSQKITHVSIMGEHRAAPFPEEEKSPFVLKPILQLGTRFDRGFSRSLEVVWYAHAKRGRWKFFSTSNGAKRANSVTIETIETLEIKGHVYYRLCARVKLARGADGFAYQILLDNALEFEATATYPVVKAKQRAVVFGDFADGASGAAKVASAAAELAPQLVVIPGDVVYKSGLFGEYRKHFEPTLNDVGEDAVPLARSTVVVAASGNHDTRIPDEHDAVQHSCREDLFAFYRIWRQPDNGPRLSATAIEAMVSKRKEGRKLLESFGPEFIRRSNFSFFCGNAQWIILDANKYMDWRNEELQEWLRKTLKAGRSKRWKFVSFHQPGFNSDPKYTSDWRMRVIAPILEEGGVDVVFSGHCHFYERHRPIKFLPNQDESGRKRNCRGTITMDCIFDGAENRKPDGVIYIVTGAGGSLLKRGLRPTDHGVSQTTAKLCDNKNSLTVLDFDDASLTISQVTPSLKVIDEIVIEK